MRVHGKGEEVGGGKGEETRGGRQGTVGAIWG
jgi:hypothetical protein